MVLVEICTDNLKDTREAIRLGADRIELCSDLSVNGLTPSDSLLSDALRLGKDYNVSIFPMIRCRGGSFVYSKVEKQAMIADAMRFTRMGVPGLVTGALTERGLPDLEFIENVARAVRDINPKVQITFHKAIDEVNPGDTDSFVNAIATLEPFCQRVLTSGANSTAIQGASEIAKIVQRGKTPFALAAGKIRSDNVAEVIKLTGVTEVHSRSPQVCEALNKPRRNL